MTGVYSGHGSRNYGVVASVAVLRPSAPSCTLEAAPFVKSIFHSPSSLTSVKEDFWPSAVTGTVAVSPSIFDFADLELVGNARLAGLDGGVEGGLAAVGAGGGDVLGCGGERCAGAGPILGLGRVIEGLNRVLGARCAVRRGVVAAAAAADHQSCRESKRSSHDPFTSCTQICLRCMERRRKGKARAIGRPGGRSYLHEPPHREARDRRVGDDEDREVDDRDPDARTGRVECAGQRPQRRVEREERGDHADHVVEAGADRAGGDQGEERDRAG